MFKGVILGITYSTWGAYKRAWNEAVKAGRLFDKKGRKITKLYPIYQGGLTDMRILSQDGKIDLPYENFSLSITQDNCIVVARDVVARPTEMLIGVVAKYSTESKARKAMEMLREAYTGIPLILQNVDISDDVKEMFEKWKKQGICVVSENQPSKIEYVGNILFRFPADDEVKV